jgi:hypothetical protein
MDKLDKKQRAALPAELFAAPNKRKLPINDEYHTRLSWEAVDKAITLSDAERSEARRRILHRAKDLNIDTSDWNKVKAISLEAMALNIETNDDHPNKMPFSGILVHLDVPSDAAPGGAFGRKIIVTTAAARKALHSLLGMAVDFTPSFDGHDTQAKVGIITSADIVGNAVAISGFVYAADFPEIASNIRALKSVLGFSFEAQRLLVADPGADILTITELTFTGAAILRKDKAAYKSTSLAASATIEGLDMTPEELKAMLTEAVAPISQRLDKIEAEAKNTVDAKKAEDKARLEAEAKAKLAASAQGGDIKAAIRAALDEQAELQKLATKQNDDMKKAVADAVEAATKPLLDKLAAAETVAKDAAAKAKLEASAPERKTVSPMVTALLARAAIGMPEGEEKLNVGKVDEALSKVSGLSIHQRIMAKNELTRVGALA